MDSQLFKEWIYFFLFGDGVSPEKKMTETASLHVAQNAMFPSFFFGW
jgi:hypothetical protein